MVYKQIMREFHKTIKHNKTKKQTNEQPMTVNNLMRMSLLETGTLGLTFYPKLIPWSLFFGVAKIK